MSSNNFVVVVDRLNGHVYERFTELVETCGSPFSYSSDGVSWAIEFYGRVIIDSESIGGYDDVEQLLQ
jgi:hypothetical protein